MSVIDLLHELRSQNIKVWVEGESLRYKTATGPFPAELRKKVSEHKADIIGYLQQLSKDQRPEQIIVVNRESNWPLSFAQQRLWFLHQYDPTNPAYQMHLHLHLHGPLNVIALQHSIDILVNRHEILRTTFVLQGDEPVQVIAPSASARTTIAQYDRSEWAHLPADERTARIAEFLRENGSAAFHMEEGPLFRVVLVRISAHEHGLLIARHHIITDARSNSLLWQELTELYSAEVEGRAHRLAPVPLQNVDFSVWQRDWLLGDTLETELTYWRRQLADCKPLLLPVDRPHPITLSYQGASERFVLSTKALEELRGVSAGESVTLFMSLLSVFYVLLYRYTAQQDISIGTPIDNRNRTELEGVMGLLLNTLVLRARPQGSMSFRQVLRHVRSLTLDAYQHQQVPFEKLVEELRPPRALNRHPLFQVMFTLDSDRGINETWNGLKVERMKGQAETAKFDLSLHLSEDDGRIRGYINYATDLFDDTTIRRMVGHFQTLLDGIVANPDCPIRQLPQLTQAERQQILVEWNQTDADYPSDKTIHHLLQEQAIRTPDALAIIDGDNRLTYRQVEEQSNQLAHYLEEIGVRQGHIVGIGMERSIDAILSIIAVLKAGAAFAPLDVVSPPTRLQRMIEEAGLTWVITNDAHAVNLKGQPSELLLFEALRQQSETCSTDRTKVMCRPDHPAYVMYTSGSTGTPKGVMIPHRAVTSLVRNTTFIDISPTDMVAHASNLAFDATTFELWGALLNGARVVLLSKETLLSAPMLSHQIQHLGIGTLFLTTALFNQLIDEDASVFAPLTNLLFGGEAVSSRHVFACLAEGTPQNLLHVYGPTETTTFATCYRFSPSDAKIDHIPIGYPLTNKRTYVLDNHQQPVPIGIPGELYVGGTGLALGYLNRPALTAERFVPDSLSGKPGTRLYRTGDLARYRENGAIEFLGRVDRQVKIRGFRVEPGEIEAILCEHPDVRDAIVGTLDDEVLGKQLIAWWIGRDGTASDPADLRDFLRQGLPAYMLPVDFVQVEIFPLNSNGKVDLAELPPPDVETRSQPSSAPKTDLERRLLAIWQQVLKRHNLGVEDNFFDVGGHSLLAVRLMMKVSEATGQELPVASLFYGPTIRQQAAQIEQKGWSPPWVSLVQVQAGGNRPPLFLVPPAAATAIRFRNFARHIGTEQPLYSFDPLGLDGQTQPLDSIEEIAAHYLHDLRQMMPEGPYLIGGMCFGAHVAFEMARQLHAQNLSAPVLFVLDASQPANGPTWKGTHRSPMYYLGRLAEFQQQGVLLHRVKRSFTLRWRRLWSLLRRQLGAETRKMEPVRIASSNAHRSYTAQAFPIRIVLFQSEEFAKYSLQDGWSVLGREGIETIHFPGTTHRSLLLEDENVEQIADKLREAIDRWMDEYGRDRFP